MNWLTSLLTKLKCKHDYVPRVQHFIDISYKLRVESMRYSAHCTKCGKCVVGRSYGMQLEPDELKTVLDNGHKPKNLSL